MGKKKNTELDELKQEWHDSVIDDTPDVKFTPKSVKIPDPEPAEFEEVHPIKRSAPAPAAHLPVYMWVDDWTLLSEVTKINKELRGYGGSKKFVNVFYGPLK